MSQGRGILRAMDATALDELMRTWAAEQHSLVSRDQLVAAAVDPRAVHRRLRSPDWEALTPRLLRLAGSPPTEVQRVMAAVLDAGGGAVASHATAAALWGLRGFALAPVELSRERTVGDRSTTLARVHHPRLLPAHHRSRVHGIPVTTLARTVVDLAGTEHPARVEIAAHDAVRHGVSWSHLEAVVDELAARGRPGIGVVRQLVAANQGRRPLESGLEAKVLRILAEAGLPEPRRQVELGGDRWVGRVDFFYDDVRLVLEVNGSEHHESPLAIRHDQRRMAALVAAGFRVLPLSEDLIRDAPHEMVALVERARRSRSA